MSAQPWETRMDRLKGAYERLDAKIDAVGNRLDAKFDAMGSRLDSRIDRIDDKIDRLGERLERTLEAMHRDQMTQFRWVVGLIVVSMLLPIARSFALH
jgi:predicted nuclease with TOPRIM domain